MKKKEKFTQVYFNEADPMMEIDTHNTNLKHRLTAFAREHPELCRIVSDDGNGCVSFEIDKRRCSFRLTEPYSDQRRQAIRETAKAQGIHSHTKPKGGETDGREPQQS